MADIFKSEDVISLIQGKSVLIIGDSNTRGLYKDLVWLSENCSYIPQRLLKAKLESSFRGDQLVDGKQATRARDFCEERRYRSPDGRLDIRFLFCTRIYSDYMKRLLDELGRAPPELVVVNSCVWDISRWGPRGVDDYKVNLRRFLQHVQRVARPDAMLVWLTTMPVSSEPRGGFLIKQVEFLRHTLRFDVMEANNFCASTVREFGYDVLDVHYHFRCLIHHRSRDGIHWSPRAVRAITNLLLTHVTVRCPDRGRRARRRPADLRRRRARPAGLSWNRPTPGRGPARLLRHLSADAYLSAAEVEAMCGQSLSARQLAAARSMRGDQAPGRR